VSDLFFFFTLLVLSPQGAPFLTMNDARSPEKSTEIVHRWIQRMASGK
jgi:hypothetical protein